MKGASSIPAVAIIPSPLFLWRFKVILFLLWGLCCCKIGWDSVMRMSADLRDLFLYEAFLYYNPLLLVALMIWLWGVNLWVFAQSSVNYARVFDLSQTHLSYREIWRVGLFLFFAICNIHLISYLNAFVQTCLSIAYKLSGLVIHMLCACMHSDPYVMRCLHS
uniref:Uncharacterized protein n=2 Tax=Avena sativa TaxID=4498 RepID=A0ACD5XRC4_AVESA